MIHPPLAGHSGLGSVLPSIIEEHDKDTSSGVEDDSRSSVVRKLQDLLVKVVGISVTAMSGSMEKSDAWLSLNDKRGCDDFEEIPHLILSKKSANACSVLVGS